MDASTSKEKNNIMTAYKTIKEKVRNNLSICAREVQTWHATAYLPDGLVREYAAELAKRHHGNMEQGIQDVCVMVRDMCISFYLEDQEF